MLNKSLKYPLIICGEIFKTPARNGDSAGKPEALFGFQNGVLEPGNPFLCEIPVVIERILIKHNLKFSA